MNNKQNYIEKIQARLNQWDAEIENMKAKAVEANADARIAIEKQIGDLESSQEEAQAKLDDLRQAGDDAWTDMKVGVEASFNQLKTATEKAISRFAA